MADPEGIYNWRRLDDPISTSGQPTETQLADIPSLGVAHVVNLALHGHGKGPTGRIRERSRSRNDVHAYPGRFSKPDAAGLRAVLRRDGAV
jgi:hypothetical protein